MTACPTCDHENRDGAKFCEECATPLGAPARPSAEERKVVTSLFCDLVGFTATSESADPEDVDKMLAAYFEMARKAIEDPDLFAAMYAYSPCHRVIDGAAYPAVFLTGGDFDPRVDACHAKKMAARLQAATSSEDPILLRIESGGHGIGQSLDQMVGLLTDVHAFAFAQLGVAWSR